MKILKRDFTHTTGVWSPEHTVAALYDRRAFVTLELGPALKEVAAARQAAAASTSGGMASV